MDAAAGIALGESGNKEGCALRGLERRWRAEVDSVLGVFLFLQGQDVDVLRFDKLLLYS